MSIEINGMGFGSTLNDLIQVGRTGFGVDRRPVIKKKPDSEGDGPKPAAGAAAAGAAAAASGSPSTLGDTGVLALNGSTADDVGGVFIGAGGFARSHFLRMVGMLKTAGSYDKSVVLVQPNRANVAEMIVGDNGSYVVDVATPNDGRPGFTTNTKTVGNVIAGAFSLGSDEVGLDPSATANDSLNRLGALPNLDWIGVGVSDKGISQDSVPIQKLAALLQQVYQDDSDRSISVYCTDNIDNKGATLLSHALWQAENNLGNDAGFKSWLEENVTFHNMMVDCMVGKRDSDSRIPSGETLPSPAMALEDGNFVSPIPFGELESGGLVFVRPDITVFEKRKLCILNATHTAAVHAAALKGLMGVDQVFGDATIGRYIGNLVTNTINPYVEANHHLAEQTSADYANGWLARQMNPNLGLTSFWVAQGFEKKVNQRFADFIKNPPGGQLPDEIPLAIALGLRYITPLRVVGGRDGVFAGKLDTGHGITADTQYHTHTDGQPLMVKKDGSFEFTAGFEGSDAPQRLMGLFGENRDTVRKALIGDSNDGVLSNFDGFDLTGHSTVAEKVVDIYYELVSKDTAETVIKRYSN